MKNRRICKPVPRNLFILGLVMTAMISLCSASLKSVQAEDIKDRKLTEEELAIATDVVENFVKLAAVPRPSHHEEKVSAF